MKLSELTFSASISKIDVLEKVKQFLKSNGYEISETDKDRPWGGYYYIDEIYKKRFAKQFFPDRDLSAMLDSPLKVTPKILIVQPGEMLSWQYHDRRGELWSLVGGQAGYKTSSIDQEPNEIHTLIDGKTETISQGTRHRLIGSTAENAEWGIVAEIWAHTDPRTPSNEEDNHRLKDKYSRK